MLWSSSWAWCRVELRVEEDLPSAGARAFADAGPRTVALAGGATPRPIYEHIANLDYRWEEVDVFFGDERCVPPDHPASNFRMAHKALLSRVSARTHPMTGCDPAGYERELAAVFGPDVPRFDLMFLGLGADGHTASLFRGDPALEITERFVALVERPDHRRMTLTLPVLSAVRLVVFLVSGEAKRDALSALLADGDIPAARVRAERVLVLADPAAAGEVAGYRG